MVGATDAARYLISLDPQLDYFNKRVISLNQHEFYEGNARLNKILHLAQNIYIGKYSMKLIDTDFYAYDNGGVIPEVQENYAFLLGTKDKAPFHIEEADSIFLRKVFNMLKDAPIKDLIDIDHEDPAWIEKHHFYYKPEQKMDSMKFIEDYQDRYEAANFYLDRVAVS